MSCVRDATSPILVEMNADGELNGHEEITDESVSSKSQSGINSNKTSESDSMNQSAFSGQMTSSTPRDTSREGSEASLQRIDMFGLAAPKYGTLVPNRIFVGGISSHTTEDELHQLFTQFGTVRGTKIIMDRAGVSKGYGFVTFETEEEAKRLYIAVTNKEMDPIILRERRLNIAPAVKKQVAYSEFTNAPMCQPTIRAEIPYGNALEPISPPSFAGTSYYFSQAQATQFYSQPAPIQDPFYAQPAPYTPAGNLSLSAGHVPPQQYYTTAGAAPQSSGPVYYFPNPNQYQTYQPLTTSAHPPHSSTSGSNLNQNYTNPCQQWRWVTQASQQPAAYSNYNTNWFLI